MLRNDGMNRLRKTASAAALALVMLLVSACGGKGGGAEAETVAKYEGGTVTAAEFNGFLGAHKFFNYSELYAFYESLPDFKRVMLDQYIAIKILTADLDEKQREESAKKAKEEMKGIDLSLRSDKSMKENLDAFLKEHNMKKDDLEKYITDQFNLQAVFENKFSDADIRAKYDEEIARDKHAFVTTATVRHILVSLTDEEGKEIRTEEEALARAKEAQAKLKNGGDWTALAKQYSDDPGSRDNGGRYAGYPVDAWVPEFRQAALEQPIGEVGDPFKTDYGYHVMLVEERSSNAYEDVKGLVKNQLVNEFFTDFIENEVPKRITEVTLPEPEESEAEDDGSPEGAENDGGESGGAEGGQGN